MSSIEEILVACLPALSSIISMVAIVASLLKKFNNLITSINDKTDQQEVIDALKKNAEEDQATISTLVDQNKQLAEQMSELVQKIEKIRKSN